MQTRVTGAEPGVRRKFISLVIPLAVALVAACGSADSGESEATQSPAQSPQTATATPAPTIQPSATPTSPPTATPSPQPTATSAPTPTATPSDPAAIRLEQIYRWVRPDALTHYEEAPDESGRVYVSDQSGQIIEIVGEPLSNSGTKRVVLDIQERVSTALEEGLLGFALHPGFADNSRFFVYYSARDPRRSVISEFAVAEDGKMEIESERIVLEVPQPSSVHNAGMLAFGPDGYLYIALGDGGGELGRQNSSQDTASLYGSILRIDVDVEGEPYGIPPDNPFVDGGGAPEIWAYGLRNPWRMSFDRLTGDLWVADVGENALEEVDLIVKGGNYGWRIKEAEDCFEPSTGCDQPGLIDPIVSYPHNFGCSVSGGYVYRGTRVPQLEGAYLYGDFCSGIIWALYYEDGEMLENTMVMDASLLIPAFGQTLDGEVYVLVRGGSPGIYRFVH